MSKEIENAISELLAGAGLTVVCAYRGEREKALSGEHAMDEWLCTITSEGGAIEQFEYFTGLGLRDPATPLARRQAEYGFQGLTANDKKGLTNYGKRYLAAVEKARKPSAPHAASVLHSLLMDSEVLGNSFARWCDEYGYDEDSRKAYAIYEACQKNADKLDRVIGRATQTALREALQDY